MVENGSGFSLLRYLCDAMKDTQDGIVALVWEQRAGSDESAVTEMNPHLNSMFWGVVGPPVLDLDQNLGVSFCEGTPLVVVLTGNLLLWYTQASFLGVP